MPSHVFKEGVIGLISRSGTLTYEIAANISEAGYGQSTCIGLGGDPITGLNFIDLLEMFEKDDDTKGVVLIGEIGGRSEEDAAEYIKASVSKPVVAYIAGRTAPPGKRMGHAGAIISGGMGTAESKISALNEAGVKVAEFPHEIAALLKEALG
jgi:succinyl-CoA synthetase alpha subunit